MRELATDGLSDDARFIVAKDNSNTERFRIPVDAALVELVKRAAASPARSGQMEIQMESSLSPREIQARIRRGESVEEVAAAAGVNSNQLEGFAVPVVAERAHMAELARSTSVRRRVSGGAPVELAALADEALGAKGFTPEDCRWDAWRREDGRWSVVVNFGGQHATFLFDAKSRYVVADDDAARNLVGDLATEEQHEMALADLVKDDPSATSSELDPAGEVHSLKEARDRRAQEQLELEPRDDDAPTLREDAELAQTIGEAEAPKSKKKPVRRSVPSWDEIMFGGQRD